jgi:hypothetical protein
MSRIDRQIIYEITGMQLRQEDNFEEPDEGDELEANLDAGPD